MLGSKRIQYMQCTFTSIYRYTAIIPYQASVNGQPANAKERWVLFWHSKITGVVSKTSFIIFILSFFETFFIIFVSRRIYSAFIVQLDEYNQRRSSPWKRRTTCCCIIFTSNSMLWCPSVKVNIYSV